LLSHYLRCLSIANSLNKNEFEIVFLRSRHYNSFVEANGYRITDNTVNAYENVVSKASKFNFSWINKQSVRQTVEAFIQVVEVDKPDKLKKIINELLTQKPNNAYVGKYSNIKIDTDYFTRIE